MAKIKKTASTPKNDEPKLQDFLIQTAKIGVYMAGKGLDLLAGLASKRNLYKTYPYLGEAFTNIKNLVSFFAGSIHLNQRGKADHHERARRKKGYKKIPKQKTLRHSR